MPFHRLIRDTEQRVSALDRRVVETDRLRRKSAEHLAEWKEATRQFHEYRSPIEKLMNGCYEGDLAKDETLREFAMDFLECDPKFFRSGYFKEFLLDKLRGVELREREKERLKLILVDAIRHRGGREYRRYCRLAARIRDVDLEASVEELIQNADSQVQARARLMRKYMVEGASAA